MTSHKARILDCLFECTLLLLCVANVASKEVKDTFPHFLGRIDTVGCRDCVTCTIRAFSARSASRQLLPSTPAVTWGPGVGGKGGQDVDEEEVSQS